MKKKYKIYIPTLLELRIEKILYSLDGKLKIIATFDDIKKIVWIAIPKKNNKGYLRAPITHFHKNNDLYTLIDNLNFTVDEHSKYYFCVRNRNKLLFDDESTNLLFNELSKKYNKDYELVEWDIFWDFIESLNK